MRRMTTVLPNSWSRLHSNAMASCSSRSGALPSATCYHFRPVHATIGRNSAPIVKVPLHQRSHSTKMKEAI